MNLAHFHNSSIQPESGGVSIPSNRFDISHVTLLISAIGPAYNLHQNKPAQFIGICLRQTAGFDLIILRNLDRLLSSFDRISIILSSFMHIVHHDK